MASSALEPKDPLPPELRVAIEVRSLDRGGLETVVAELARGLPAFGVAPVVICTERGGAIADELRAAGCTVEVLTGADRPAEMAALLEHHGVQLLNAHYSSLGAPLAAAREIPVVSTLHNAYAWLGAAVLEEIRTLDPHVALYVAVSESVADFTARRFLIDRRRIAVVRNGVRARRPAADDATRAALRAELGIDPGAELVVQVASVTRMKCQLALVDAIAELREARPRLRAWLVGPVAEEDYGEQVRRRIAESGLEDRVTLLGQRDDVDRILGAADLFALPSILEGLSLAAVEALAAGVPVVLTRTGDADFLVGGEGAGDAGAGDPDDRRVSATAPGVLVDGPRLEPWAVNWMSLREIAGVERPAHASSVARAIAELLDDLPARRAAARARGAALAATLTPEAMCGRTAGLLLRVATAHARGRADELARALVRADAANAALHASVSGIAAQLAELGERISGLRGEVRATAEQQARTIEIATRTLDKLRLKDRAKKALHGLRARVLGRPAAAARAPRQAQARGEGGGGSEEPVSGPRARSWWILAVVPFDDIGGGQRSAQLARALAARGERVVYAARFPRSESRDLGIAVDVPGIEIVPWDPGALRARLAACDGRVAVLVEAPEPEVLELAREAGARGARLLYDKVDHWEACSWADWFRPETETALADLADDLIASAGLLARQLGARGRTVHLLPNAVDRERFAPRPGGAAPPSDLRRGEATLVYAGSLWGDWFDWELVAGVGAQRPAWTIALIGDPPPRLPDALPPNVHFLGLKPQSALPAYYAAADACLIPFRATPVVAGLNPLKVYEYLAMGRPVVATPMPELEGAPHVFTAASAEETVRAVEAARVAAFPAAEVEDFLARNTWTARAGALAAIVAEPTIAVVVLCYNNRDVIGRCIDSLRAHRGRLRYEIAVVDNGSTDGSLELLAARAGAGEITLLRNDRNGCSSGRNLGVARTRSEIVVFLDSDQWALGDGWLDPALAILREHREIGAVAWNAGWFDAERGPGATVDNLPERGMTGAHAGARFRSDVAYLATSGFVVPRAVLRRTRGFDEAFDPTCYEDTDLSFQIKAAGYEIAFCPDIGVGHHPHQTTGSLDGYRELLARNGRYFLDKWRDRPEYFFDVPEAPGVFRA